MPAAALPPLRTAPFLLTHGVCVPLLLATLALLAMHSRLDMALTTLLYDGSGHFVAGSHGWVERLGHRLLRSVLTALWLLLLAAALSARWLPLSAHERRVLWLTVVAMGLGPLLVTGLKDINTHACPWNLQAFGGLSPPGNDWFVARIDAGRCFPSGHAAAGFSPVALAFAGHALGRPALQRRGLWLAVLAGGVASTVRLAQGAHFMSHNLWSAAIDWWVASAVFLPLLWRPSLAANQAKA